jgi:hypothetical protein
MYTETKSKIHTAQRAKVQLMFVFPAVDMMYTIRKIQVRQKRVVTQATIAKTCHKVLSQCFSACMHRENRQWLYSYCCQTRISLVERGQELNSLFASRVLAGESCNCMTVLKQSTSRPGKIANTAKLQFICTYLRAL